LCDIGIRQAEPQLFGELIERGFGNQLSKQLPIDAARPRFFRRDGMPELTAQLLEALVVELTKLLNRYFGATDGSDCIAAEAAENVANAPDRKADHEEAHDNGHEAFAEPG
jgi:hypothetical protein